MPLTRLILDKFRNIDHAELLPAAQLNFIHGENGSGKTSLLEAISTLAMGRSFRTRKYTHVIQDESPAFQLFAESASAEQMVSIGVVRARNGQSQFKLAGRVIHSSADLAANLPLQVIDAQSFMLLEGGPSQRRRFLDWLVFHVKPEFARAWLEYSRCLKQRNSLLRRDKIPHLELQPWTQRLAEFGARLDGLRQDCVDQFIPHLGTYLRDCGFLNGQAQIAVEYLPGWRPENEIPFLDQFEQNLDRDIRLGYTSIGPHRSDLNIQFRGKGAVQVLSRGQQKSLINAMYMAQLSCFRGLRGEKECVLLVDDLPAELDQTNRGIIANWISHLRVQTFVTGIDLQDLTQPWQPSQMDASKVFHVKHGNITEQ